MVAAIGAEVASALAYAHALTDLRGARLEVIHRDVSPTNILLTSSGGVKLSDFGIAAARGALERGLAGEVPGKLGYMPHEQSLGLPSDDRVDVFALGAVLYELATFERANPEGHSVGRRRAPVEALRPGFPPALASFIDAALADDPAARPTAEVLALGLTHCVAPPEGGLGRAFALVVSPIEPVALADEQAAVTPMNTPQVQRGAHRLIGRAEEINALLERFTAGARAVTLVGAPGMGKSAIARHLVEAHAGRWPHGWIASLEDARPPWGLPLALSRVLEVPLDTGESPAQALERLGRALADQTRASRGVLLLDDADAFCAALRSVVPAWLEAAPLLEIVVVSRERPGFGETVLVGPLTPEAGAQVLRARLGRAVTPEEEPALRALVERLERVPLALELAAASAHDISLVTLEAGLASGAPLASSPALSAALASSMERLSETELSTLEQLAVFAGGFQLAAATEVVLLPKGAPTLEVLVERLLQRSLVRRLAGSDQRFGLYEVIRAWGLARLAASAQLEATAARHTHFFVREGARRAAAATGRMARVVADSLLAELQNLLLVHQRALEALPMSAADVSHALTVALVLDPALSVRGPLGLLLSLLDSALVAARVHEVHPPLRARALLVRGNLLRELGRLADAQVDLEQGLQLAADVGDVRLEALAHSYRTALFTEQANYELAADELSRADALAAGAGERRTQALLAGQRALLALEQGRLDDAQVGYRAAMSQLSELGDRRLEGIGAGHLATLYLELRKGDDARACYQLALSLLGEVGDVRSVAIFGGYLALVELLESNLDQAMTGLRKSIDALGELGELRYRALFEACLGSALAQCGQLGRARALMALATTRLVALGDTVFLEAVAVHRHQLARAAGESVPLAPTIPARDNDVRLAWVLLSSGGLSK